MLSLSDAYVAARAMWFAAMLLAVVGCVEGGNADRVRVVEQVVQPAGAHHDGVLGSFLLIESDETYEVVNASVEADDGLVATVPGECHPGCPGSGFYEADLGEPGGQFAASAYPVTLNPDKPTRLLLRVTVDKHGKRLLEDGDECLFVRRLNLRLSNGDDISLGFVGEPTWLLGVPPDDNSTRCK